MAMLAAMSHDLRTPITGLQLSAELLEQGETTARILRTLDEMQRMAEVALPFIRENMQPDGARTVDLHALIDGVAVVLTDLDHQLTVFHTGRMLIDCRPVALRRAFRNLLGNAGVHVVCATIRIAHTDSGLSVVIEDEGSGIPEADRGWVFEPFVRLDESRCADKGGAGLGLAAARTIIRGHGEEHHCWRTATKVGDG